MTTARITYLFHSGFMVEIEKLCLIFDYYQPRAFIKHHSAGIVSGRDLTKFDQVLVFVSHSHMDHYDPHIWDWRQNNPQLRYIISSDVSVPDRRGTADIRQMQPYENLVEYGCDITSFGSTDAGLSFLVNAAGFSLFHAGDLNWWHWKEDTPEDQRTAAAAFKAEIAKIAGRRIDIAFFPVDPRLEEFYYLGAEYFCSQLHPGILIPMHFGRSYKTTALFAARNLTTSQPIVLTHRGQVILYEQKSV